MPGPATQFAEWMHGDSFETVPMVACGFADGWTLGGLGDRPIRRGPLVDHTSGGRDRARGHGEVDHARRRDEAAERSRFGTRPLFKETRMPGLQHTVTIATPPERVWAVVVDVERWPERIPTVDGVERLDAGPLAVGSRTRLQQPRLPTAVWTVTQLADGSSYTWESSSPGVTVTATHVVEPHPDGAGSPSP